MGTLGSKVIVTTQDEFERLIVMKTAVKGEFDPVFQSGVVYFASIAAAVVAWRTL